MQPIERLASILDCLAYSNDPEVSINFISSSTGLSPSTVHRYLNSLKKLNYVQQNPVTAKYQLGYKFIELGAIVFNRINLRTIALPEMIKLRDLSKETVYLSIRTDYLNRMYIEQVKSEAYIRVEFPLVKPIPLYVGVSGHLLSAWLPHEEIDDICRVVKEKYQLGEISIDAESFCKRLQEIRQKGYVRGKGEFMADVSTLAAPIRDSSGNVVAALSVSGPSTRFTPEKQDSVLPALLRAANAISKTLGYVDDE